MAFRSELAAQSERADAAEAEAQRLKHELSEQKARIDRVGEIESQLETARAQIRESKDSPLSILRGGAVWLVAGAVLGVGAGVFYGSTGAAEERRAREVVEARATEAQRLAADAAAAARRDVETARSERDELSRMHGDERDELREVLYGLTLVSYSAAGTIESSPIAFGRVIHVDGVAPAQLRDMCEITTLPEPETCVAQVRCGDVVLHSLGCSTAVGTRLRRTGGVIDVVDPFNDWLVRIQTSVVLFPGADGGSSMRVIPAP